MSIIQLFEERLQTAVHDWVKQGAALPEKSVRLSGVLYLSRSGWLLLSVPNALVRGAFSALNEPGVELPLRDGKLNAHITVFRPEEIEQVGGPEKFLKDRGKSFHYTLGPTQTVTPEGWKEMSKVWFIKIDSPELKSLRKSYGLPPLPNDNEHDLHCTIAVRRKKVMQENEVSKAASHVRVKVPADKGQYLLHHYLNAQEWGHPAGKIEEGEEASAAALRELLERTGYEGNAADLKPLEQVDQFQEYEIPYAKLKKMQGPQTEIKIGEALNHLMHKTALRRIQPTVAPGSFSDLASLLEIEKEPTPLSKVLRSRKPKRKKSNDGMANDMMAGVVMGKRADSIIKDVQEIVDGDNVFKSFDGGYGYVMWDPVGKRLHFVSGDWYENDDVREAKALLEGVDGVDEVTADAEYFERGVKWTKIERGKTPVEIEKPSSLAGEKLSAEVLSPPLEAGLADANAQLTQEEQLAKTLRKLHNARMYSNMGLYNVKQDILRKMMAEAPQEWVVDQPEKYHPGITHTPTGYKLHIDRASIPPTVLPKQQEKKAAGSMIERMAWGTPIRFDQNRNLLQNLADHFNKIRGNFRTGVNSRRFASNLSMVNNPQAKLQNLANIVQGNDPVLAHPYDQMFNRWAG